MQNRVPKTAPKSEFLAVADALNAGGKGVWLGWREDRGWVFLDRTKPLNKGRNNEFWFIQASDWSLYREDRGVWKSGDSYTFYAQRLGLAGAESKAEVKLAVEAHCREYVERAPKFWSPIERSFVEYEEASAAARLQDTRRRDEERRQVEQTYFEKSMAAEAARVDAARRRDEERRYELERIAEVNRKERDARLNARKVTMLRRQKAEAEGIRRFVQERKIPFLVHFTRIDNLPGIVASGIAPRAELSAELPHTHNDAQRLDGFLEASSLSVSFPNYRMFYAYRCQNPDLNWAIVTVSTETLVDEPCLFYPTNAANGRFRNEGEIAPETCMGLNGLTSMFVDEPPGIREERKLPPH